jgi:hypothetical protein
MLALTILYSLVFFYIRGQLRKFSNDTEGNSSTDRQSSGQELEQWQADLETGEPFSEPAPRQIMTTRMVSVTTEDRGATLASETASGVPISLRNTPSSQSHLIARKRMLQVARSLLWYPLIYLCVTAPLTIGRLAQFAHDDWAQTCIFVGAAFYASAGWCNVLLYTTTRKGIVSWTCCGRNQKPHHRRHSKSQLHPFPGSPTTPQDKYGSHSSTMTSGSIHSNEEVYPRVGSSSSIGQPDSKGDMHFEGVDFTHSVGFDTINIANGSKVTHDRYCLQNRMEAGDTDDKTACTCKNVSKDK